MTVQSREYKFVFTGMTQTGKDADQSQYLVFSRWTPYVRSTTAMKLDHFVQRPPTALQLFRWLCEHTIGKGVGGRRMGERGGGGGE